MNRFFSNPLNWLLLLSSIVITTFFVFVAQLDYASDIPIEKPAPHGSLFNLYAQTEKIDFKNLKETFPYASYLDSANLRDINAIRKDIDALDSLNPDQEMLNQEILSIAYTEKLEERMKPSFKKYNPDSLIQIIQWAEKFNSYSEIDEPHAILFQVIYSHWFSFVSNTLGEYYKNDYAIKYNYKFRYISDRIKEQQFSTPIKWTYLEKVVSQAIQKNWSYLFNKFWHATSIPYKLSVLFIILLIVFPYLYIFKRGLKNK